MRTQDIDGTYNLRRFQSSQLESLESEEILWHQIGSFGKWQWIVFAIILPVSLFGAFQDFDIIFIAYMPTHWCRISELETTNWTLEQIRNISLPPSDDGIAPFDQCSYYLRNYTYLSQLTFQEAMNNVSKSVLPPRSGCANFTYDYTYLKSTLAVQWNLVCDRRVLRSLLQTIYMAGVLVGCLISGLLSDKFGRRPIIRLFICLWIVMAYIEAFATDYVFYIIFRFCIAVFCFGTFVVAFVLLSEIVGPSHRSSMGMLYQMPFSVGFTLIPGIAYFVREWRTLQYIFSFTSVFVLITVWLTPESPRWLIVNGRLEEAKEILETAAMRNGKTLKRTDIQVIVDHVLKANRQEFVDHVEPNSLSRRCVTAWGKLLALVRTREMCRRTILSYLAWFVVALMYYGLSLSAPYDNTVNIFLLYFITTVVEIPAELMAVPLIDRFGRRKITSLMFLIAGTSCLMQLSPNIADYGSALFLTISKLCVTAVFGIVYIYEAELYPTEVRNMGVGGASVFARFGGMLAPMLADRFQNSISLSVPTIVFGVSGLVAAITTMFLPETNKQKLPDTIEQVERRTKKLDEENSR